MTDINVKFVYPVNGGSTDVTLDDGITGEGAIDELVANGEIPDNGRVGYLLTLKGAGDVDRDQTLRAAGVRDGSTIVVSPRTVAGS